MNLLQSMLMKKIEATIQANKINLISDAITGVVSGFTVIEGNGRGSGKRQKIRAERGTKTIRAEYNKVAIISTIVDDSMVEKICKIIEEEAYTGENTDGIIVISNIENIFNIGTKK